MPKNKKTKSKSLVFTQPETDFCHNCGTCEYCTRFSHTDVVPDVCEMCSHDYYNRPHLLRKKNINEVEKQLCVFCITDFNQFYRDFFKVMTLREINEYIDECTRVVSSYHFYDSDDKLQIFRDNPILDELTTLYKDRYFIWNSPRMSWIALCVGQGFINDIV